MLQLMQSLSVLAFGKVRPTARRVARSLIGAVVAGLFGLTAYIALLIALGIFLSREFGPLAAALIVAAATAFVAIMVVVVIGAFNRRSERRILARQRAARARLPDPVTLQILAGLPTMMRGKSLLATAAIAAVVFVLAKSQGSGSARDDDD
ncbi:hypothetical protein [Rhizobium sp. CECT 9324]|jgi:hypothetical protein|uniref:hypothetical protein n=1 Tax=Rhizobium sp. CECT 9324 TaxID=2845820 RepID=UPI001E6226E8|nr:hypothetical protein [Rhizobium sp. CECT 9324]CAH0341942.1 hypothetical protein RHI9324_03650 [Rhizobium sp. CECT 9324]